MKSSVFSVQDVLFQACARNLHLDIYLQHLDGMLVSEEAQSLRNRAQLSRTP